MSRGGKTELTTEEKALLEANEGRISEDGKVVYCDKCTERQGKEVKIKLKHLFHLREVL